MYIYTHIYTYICIYDCIYVYVYVDCDDEAIVIVVRFTSTCSWDAVEIGSWDLHKPTPMKVG